jgi:hypothetical protein
MDFTVQGNAFGGALDNTERGSRPEEGVCDGTHNEKDKEICIMEEFTCLVLARNDEWKEDVIMSGIFKELVIRHNSGFINQITNENRG